ncbi:Cyanovirin-N [Aspergillus avenaceus]|uniref:Cyanovirin-N n=1 Tax=Aspergillus avenaceus TaxID=36643 RepID=A0A5N6TTZ8_ASPAV|nr:Cyanovirin-N [Aspergillus avenaceus]
MKAPSTVALLCMSGLAAAGGFEETCTDISLTSNLILKANCHINKTDVRKTELDLKDFFYNDNGILTTKATYGASSSFADSCTECELTNDPINWFQCLCRDWTGFVLASSLDLDKHISNQGGNLHFDPSEDSD